MKEIEGVLASITSSGGRSPAESSVPSRLDRRPDFKRPAIHGTRPRTAKGQTFHFQHKTISKRNSVSQSQTSMTVSAAHQAYIERAEAVEPVDPKSQPLTLTAPRVAQGELDADRSPPAAGFRYPETLVEAERSSFGTLGKTRSERIEFWRQVELSAGRSARVQNRIIAELPYEITPFERYEIARSFCAEFEALGLPYWATVHSPTQKNDRRNFHLHIAYLDRPAAQNDAGRWDFSITEMRKKKNRNRVQVRPFRRPKLALTRSRNWVKTLRQSYSEHNNNALDRHGYEKRLDPRSYKESGIQKFPTEHLGPNSNAAEKFGLDTIRGRRNARREYAWRIASSAQRWDEKSSQLDLDLLLSEPDDDVFENVSILRSRIDKGRAIDIEAEKTTILNEAVHLRYDRRKTFLEDEIKRAFHHDTILTRSASLNTALVATEELSALAAHDGKVRSLSSALSQRGGELKERAQAIWNSLEVGGGGASQQQTQAPELDMDIDDLLSPAFDNAFETLSMENDEEALEETSAPEVQQSEQVATGAQAENQARIDLPYVFEVAEIKTPEQLRQLDRTLMEMTNIDVRTHAVMTKDMADILPQGQQRTDVNRGWVILQAEAERRGIDLDTGRQHIDKATDLERAKLHRDERALPVLELRQELTRIQVR